MFAEMTTETEKTFVIGAIIMVAHAGLTVIMLCWFASLVNQLRNETIDLRKRTKIIEGHVKQLLGEPIVQSVQSSLPIVASLERPNIRSVPIQTRPREGGVFQAARTTAAQPPRRRVKRGKRK